MQVRKHRQRRQEVPSVVRHLKLGQTIVGVALREHPVVVEVIGTDPVADQGIGLADQ